MPKTKGPAPVSFARWAEEKNARLPVSKCATCSRYPEFLEHIREFAAMRRAGALKCSMAEFRKEFLVPLGYMLSDRALAQHLQKCVGGISPG